MKWLNGVFHAELAARICCDSHLEQTHLVLLYHSTGHLQPAQLSHSQMNVNFLTLPSLMAFTAMCLTWDYRNWKTSTKLEMSTCYLLYKILNFHCGKGSQCLGGAGVSKSQEMNLEFSSIQVTMILVVGNRKSRFQSSSWQVLSKHAPGETGSSSPLLSSFELGQLQTRGGCWTEFCLDYVKQEWGRRILGTPRGLISSTYHLPMAEEVGFVTWYILKNVLLPWSQGEINFPIIP